MIEYYQKTCRWNRSLWKLKKFELKKYRGVIFHDTEQWCKIWIKPDLVVSKMAEELGELSLEHPKVWKLYIDGPFLSKAYTVSVRNFRGIMCHDTKGCCKV